MIGAIVLAAGESRRMKRHKVLLPMGEASVIEHIVGQLADSKADEIVVVVGHHGDDVVERLKGREITFVQNDLYKDGMLSSIRAGLKAASGWDGALIVLGDQPSLSHTVVDELISRFEPGSGQLLLPTHDGKRGHPLLIDMQYKEEILTSFDDQGLRGLLQAHADSIQCVELPTDDVLRDMDYPEDYERERDAFDARISQ